MGCRWSTCWDTTLPSICDPLVFNSFSSSINEKLEIWRDVECLDLIQYALPYFLSQKPTSKVILDGGSEAIGSQRINPRLQPGANFSSYWFLGVQLPFRNPPKLLRILVPKVIILEVMMINVASVYPILDEYVWEYWPCDLEGCLPFVYQKPCHSPSLLPSCERSKG